MANLWFILQHHHAVIRFQAEVHPSESFIAAFGIKAVLSGYLDITETTLDGIAAVDRRSARQRVHPFDHPDGAFGRIGRCLLYTSDAADE